MSEDTDQIIQQIVINKLNDFFGEEVPQQLVGASRQKQFELIFRCYNDQLQFYKQAIKIINNQNAELKVREIQLEDKLAEVTEKLADIMKGREAASPTQKSNIKNNHTKLTISEEQKLQLTRILKQRQQEINQLNERCKQLEQQKSANQGEFEVNKIQINNLQQNEKTYEADIKKLQEIINNLAKQNEDNRKLYEEKFIQDFQKSVNQLRDNETAVRKSEKVNLQKKIKELEESLRTIVNRVNDLLSISISTSGPLTLQEQKDWIAQIQVAAKKHLKEVNKYCRNGIRQSTEQTLAVSDLAMLQKEKITARRMYLLNTMFSEDK